MSWVTDVLRFRHDMFIAFFECKINNRGNWQSATAFDDKTGHELLRAVDNSEHNTISVVEPDGIRRNFLVRQGGSIGMYQNVISYNSEFLSDIIIDEKEQSGKGKTRDKLQ